MRGDEEHLFQLACEAKLVLIKSNDFLALHGRVSLRHEAIVSRHGVRGDQSDRGLRDLM